MPDGLVLKQLFVTLQAAGPLEVPSGPLQQLYNFLPQDAGALAGETEQILSQLRGMQEQVHSNPIIQDPFLHMTGLIRAICVALLLQFVQRFSVLSTHRSM